jgi:Flp pilus assembly protein TadD
MAAGLALRSIEPQGEPLVAQENVDVHLLHQQFQQAVALLQHGEYDYAVQGFHEVLKVAPDMPEAHVNMGFALLGLEEYAAARSFFDTATNLRPGQTNAYYGLAVAHEGLGDLRQAVAAMRAYTHIADDDEQYRRKAEAAIWEWEAELTAKEQ